MRRFGSRERCRRVDVELKMKEMNKGRGRMLDKVRLWREKAKGEAGAVSVTSPE